MARKRRVRRTGKGQPGILRALLLIIICSLGVFYFIQSPFWSVKKVLVEGNQFITSKELVQLSGVPMETNILKVDLQQSRENLRLHPLVKDSKLIRKLPGTVVIHIVERTPVALLPYIDGFREIDEEQIILRNTPTVNDVELPLITGLAIEDLGPGDPVTSEELGDALQFIQACPTEMLERIMEIDLSAPGTIYLHVLEGFQINFGNMERVDEKIKLMTEIFASPEIKKSELQYVDLSFAGPPVIKLGK